MLRQAISESLSIVFVFSSKKCSFLICRTSHPGARKNPQNFYSPMKNVWDVGIATHILFIFLESLSDKKGGFSISEASNDDNSSKCSNCRRFVPKSSLILHEMHCHRNFYICSECDKVVKVYVSIVLSG